MRKRQRKWLEGWSLRAARKWLRHEWRDMQGSHQRWLGGVRYVSIAGPLGEGVDNIEVRPGFTIWNLDCDHQLCSQDYVYRRKR